MHHEKMNHCPVLCSKSGSERRCTRRPQWALVAMLIALVPAWQSARAGGPMSPPVAIGDDVCDSGTNIGAPCSTNADCGGGVCALKNRYISFVPPAGSSLAIRVKLVSLPEFPSFDGAIRWVGSPASFQNTLSPDDGTFEAARLECDPHVQDWTGVGLLNVFGSEIVATNGDFPRPVYEVRTATPACIALGVETCLSDPLIISTGKWADVLSPFADSGCDQPELNDLVFLGSLLTNESLFSFSTMKTRAQLVPNNLDPSLPVTFHEATAWFTGFVCSGYPFTGPETCPHRVPACGDGVRDANEECDDGNGMPGDGCDAACKLENATAIVSLVPVDPVGSNALPYPAGTSIDGNTISLPSSVRRIWLEIKISNWDPGGLAGTELRTWQVQIDPAGYASGSVGVLTPAQEPCTDDVTCTMTLGEGSLCDTPLCRAGFTESPERSDSAPGVLSLVPDTSSLEYRYGNIDFLNANVGLDDGTERYAGTLVLDIPPDALGTFTIGFKEGLFETFLLGLDLEDIIPIAEFRPAVVEINNTKSRYVSVPVPAIAPGTLDPFAIRMKIVDAPQFPASVGQIRWAGAPNVVAGTPVEGPIFVSQVQCDPEVRQWVNIDNVSLYGKSIVPGATYELRTATADCVLMGGETCLSDPVMIGTGQWGDLVPPFGGTGQPNFADISNTVAVFVGTPTAPSITRGDLVPEVVNQVANFSDIAADVGAFGGLAYPFAGPGTCAP